MVAGNFVKLFPLSYFFERPTVAFFTPTDRFASALPPEILKYLRENAIVNSLEKLNNRGWRTTNDLFPSRGIIVEFKGTEEPLGMLYHLVQSEVVEMNEETRTVTWKHTLPTTPPEKDEFEAWVDQSINSASMNAYNKIFLENT